MRRNVVLSVLLHVVIIAVAYFGIPNWRDTPELVDVPMTVEIVTVSDKTNLPTKPKESKPVEKQEPKPAPKPPAPPPAPQGSVQEPPKPEPVPEAKDDAVAILDKPADKPKPEEKPKPKEEPKKTDSPKRAPAPLPPKKPKAPDDFASVLKTLEDLKTAPKTEEKTDAKTAEPDFTQMMENALESDKQRIDVGPELTISEIDLVRQQIQRCWNLPAGAKDAHTMQISIRIAMNPDGTVQTARILEDPRMYGDTFYRTMAESALRAVLNPACQPFKLPPDKYARWKDLKLNFDPREMFGL